MLRIQNTKDYLNEHTLVVQIYVLVQRMQVWYLASLLQISAGGVLRWWDYKKEFHLGAEHGNDVCPSETGMASPTTRSFCWNVFFHLEP